MIHSIGKKAVVEFPVNVSEVEKEEGVEYVAETVYSLETTYTSDLADRIEASFDAWLDRAKVVEPQETTLADVIDAVNALTDIVLGGDF